MAERRGRKPAGNYKQKTHVFSTRITADLRQELELAAKNSGHSLSQEVEHRLRRSFLNDREIDAVFGNRRNFAVLRLVSTLMEAIHNPAIPGASWIDDPYTFDQLIKTINLVLEAVQPPGDARAPPLGDPIDKAAAEHQSGMIAARLLYAIKDAPPQLSLDSRSPASLIRGDLGAAADRIGKNRAGGPRLVRGTAADLKRAAEEMEKKGDDQ